MPICLFVCPIIAHDHSFYDLPHIFIWELGKTTGIFFVWCNNSQLRVLTFLQVFPQRMRIKNFRETKVRYLRPNLKNLSRGLNVVGSA